MSEQSRRITAEQRRSIILSKKFSALAERVHRLRDTEFYELWFEEAEYLACVEHQLLAMSKARVGAR